MMAEADADGDGFVSLTELAALNATVDGDDAVVEEDLRLPFGSSMPTAEMPYLPRSPRSWWLDAAPASPDLRYATTFCYHCRDWFRKDHKDL